MTKSEYQESKKFIGSMTKHKTRKQMLFAGLFFGVFNLILNFLLLDTKVPFLEFVVSKKGTINFCVMFLWGVFLVLMQNLSLIHI